MEGLSALSKSVLVGAFKCKAAKILKLFLLLVTLHVSYVSLLNASKYIEDIEAIPKTRAKRNSNNEDGHFEATLIPPKFKTALEIRKLLLEEDLQDFDEKWMNGLIPNNGGKPIRNLIVSSWRSGSSFASILAASFPGTFFIFEPFMYMGSRRMRGSSLNKSIDTISSLYNCDFNHTELLTHKDYNVGAVMKFTPYVRNFCHQFMYQKACTDPSLVKSLCKLYPVQLMKVVRFPLESVKPLLEDEELDLRVLYLVRDPRGTMKSRVTKSKYWCRNHTDCSDVSILCQDLENDFQAWNKLNQEYPGRVMRMRYEDLSLNPKESTEKILSFFRLSMQPKVKFALNQRTTQYRNDEFSTFRNSKRIVFNWIKHYANHTKDLVKIQETCKKTLRLWKYKPLELDSVLKYDESTNVKDDVLENLE